MSERYSIDLTYIDLTYIARAPLSLLCMLLSPPLPINACIYQMKLYEARMQGLEQELKAEVPSLLCFLSLVLIFLSSLSPYCICIEPNVIKS